MPAMALNEMTNANMRHFAGTTGVICDKRSLLRLLKIISANN